MLATRVIAIRHGETAWNAEARIQGHLDIPLSEVGLAQARRLARALAGEDLNALYSSDLARARQTAEPLARALGLSLRLEPGLRERSFGRFEGMTFAEIGERWPDEHRRWRERDPRYGPEGGEVLEQFYARIVATATALCEAHPGESIALVAHGGVLDCLYRAATRADLRATRTWALGNASVNRLLHTPQGFTLVGWGDARHLDDPALDESAEPAAAPRA
jgi:2,3-bisphosphoglycerate-dependent phosphoglycerate mutase